MEEEVTSTIRIYVGTEDTHYGGNLAAGAMVMGLFGDIATEIAIKTDGDEGLLAGYSSVEFLAPIYAGDFIEATGKMVRLGNTSRTIEFEARKVITARRDIGESAADVLDQPIVVARATGTTVVKKEHSRRRA